jgi:hypothetical protein
MSLDSELVQKLFSTTDLTDVVGNRIYHKKAKQGVQTPYIVWHEINSNNNQCLGGNLYQTDGRFQVDIWGDNSSIVKQLREVIKALLVGFKSSNSISTFDDYESETELYRESIDFKLKG